MKKAHKQSHHRQGQIIRRFLHDGLRLTPRSLRRSGFFVTVIGTMRKHRHQLRASVEALRPRGFAVRKVAPSSEALPGVHRIPHPTFVTIREAPLFSGTGRPKKCQ